jgi:thioredoxin reductase (NADPH)
MPKPLIVVYGADWCPDCSRAKKYLSQQMVNFRWVDIERDPEARAYVERVNKGKRIIPTIVFDDESILVEPTNAELAQKLALQAQAQVHFYDLIIIGGGAAGLTTAIYAARENIRTLVLEQSGLGGQAGITERIEHLPGFPDGVGGTEFAERIAQQALGYGAEILQAQEVTRIQVTDNYRIVHLSDGTAYNSNAVLLATGATNRRLNVPGENELMGAGVHYCATCDAPFYSGAKQLAIVGGGPTAAEQALFLTQFAERVTLLVSEDHLTAGPVAQDNLLKKPAVDVKFNTEVVELRGNRKLAAVVTRNLATGTLDEMHPAGVFVFIGSSPNNALVQDLVALDPEGYILTGHDLIFSVEEQVGDAPPPKHLRIPHAMETNIRGIFAAGDVRSGSIKQVAGAFGEGASAAIAIREYLRAR